MHQPKDGPASVAMLVERPETLLLLLRDQPQLNHALTQAGIPETGRQISIELAPASTGSDATANQPPGDRAPDQQPTAQQPAAQQTATQPATPSAADHTASFAGYDRTGHQSGQPTPRDDSQRRPPTEAERRDPPPLAATRPASAGIDITA